MSVCVCVRMCLCEGVCVCVGMCVQEIGRQLFVFNYNILLVGHIKTGLFANKNKQNTRTGGQDLVIAAQQVTVIPHQRALPGYVP